MVAYALLFLQVHNAKLVAGILGSEVPKAVAGQPLQMLAAGTVFGQAITILVAAAAIPLLIYVLFLVSWLGLEVIRAMTALDTAEGGGGTAED